MSFPIGARVRVLDNPHFTSAWLGNKLKPTRTLRGGETGSITFIHPDGDYNIVVDGSSGAHVGVVHPDYVVAIDTPTSTPSFKVTPEAVQAGVIAGWMTTADGVQSGSVGHQFAQFEAAIRAAVAYMKEHVDD